MTFRFAGTRETGYLMEIVLKMDLGNEFKRLADSFSAGKK